MEAKLRWYRTWYAGDEIVETWAYSATEVYAMALKHGGSGVIQILVEPNVWRTVLAFQIPAGKVKVG